MLCTEDRIDTAFFPYEPKSLDGLIHNDHLATPQKMTVLFKWVTLKTDSQDP